MKYADILQSCIERLRHGEPLDAIITEHPQYAEQLRFDLSAAEASRSVSTRLPEPSSDARARFQLDLQAQRRVATTRPQRRVWLRWSILLPATAATAAAVLVVAALAAGVILPTSTAEASFDAIVVANDGTNLTVQTDEGLQSVELSDAVGADESGASVDPATLEPGQLVHVRGRKAEAAGIAARRIEARAAEALQAWCQRFEGACSTAERELTDRIDRCEQSPEVCSRVRARLQTLRNEIDARRRVSDLQRRCDNGNNAACREVQQLCSSERPVCAAIREWLRNHRPARQ